MRNALIFVVVLMLSGTSAYAQTVYNGSIGIFADDSTTDPSWCLSAAPGVLYVYFLHTNAHGATTSQWAAPPPACLTAVHLADLPVFTVTVGNTESGICIGYGMCKTGWFHIMTAVYQVTSVGQCCDWHVVADPNLPSGRIAVLDCDSNLDYGNGWMAIFDTNPSCCSTPNDESTWGKVKALYVE